MRPCKLKLVLSIIIYSLILLFLSLYLLGCVRPFELISPSVGIPVVLRRHTDLICAGITQVVTDGDCIYVLYGRHSVVQVYSTGGQYLYSISVYNHLNGRTEIAINDNVLYVQDKVGNIYHFSEGQFVSFIDRNGNDLLSNSLSFGMSDSNYEVRQSSVWYLPKNEEQCCVIQRPMWLAVYQNGTIDSILFVLGILWGMTLFISTQRK